MGKVRLVLLALILVTASCVSSETVVASGGGGSQLAEDAEGFGGLGLRCGAVTFPDRSVDLGLLPLFTEDLSTFIGEDASAEFDLIGDWLSGLTFYEIERTDERLVLFAERPDSVRGAAPYFDAVFEQSDGAWRASGWGDCWMQADADGFGIAELALDPQNQPTEDSTSLALLATERACASGLLPEGREVRPLVVESDQSVQIIVLIEESTGAQDCQGNPPFAIDVDLTRRLGSRIILDTAFAPPTELVWPIPIQISRLQIVLLGDAPAAGTANVFTWSDPSAGGLLVQAPVWGIEPGWIQSFDGDSPRTIQGFVGECIGGTCEEECESVDCASIKRLGPECEAAYEPGGITEDTIFTITYTGTNCTIDITSTPID